MQAAVVTAAQVIDRIVAVVDEDVITQSELQESMLPFIADYKLRYKEEEMEGKMGEVRQDALNRLIEERLILQEAKKRKIAVDDSEIKERLEHVKKRFDNEEEFYLAIKDSGITMARLKEKYKEQIMMRNLVRALINTNVNISPTEIAAYYNGNIKDFSVPKMARFKVLLVKPLPDSSMAKTEKIASQILDRINDGQNFDMLVKQFSQGPNIDKGGDMGYMPAGGIIKELDDQIELLNAGDTSGIIKTETGFYIIKVIDKKEAGIDPLSEVKDMIRERLYQRESELTLREFIGKLKKDAYIRIK
jgi:parvulin-like peptidyl-prolyl isomerase